ncbi:short chain dehydrogenase [Colletotrichum graminicola]|uniref:Short chain dehydrogenase n=1 Tax=Colletotrichum graminicola (strain M1.001 / M2 / FGSC 10212) TaxID=645133 RepID=E3QSU1_COLGM|nr:short chain dehydrogenase [Colletotrichum graminicola M1.001]EFQ33929.1 short chain dehydrogenase [Colletotrichum graminicola M1.001]WDK21119.1 short chain dehydrogenase [Colletotrichum graminicola]
MNPVNSEPYTLPSDATWLITGCSSGIGKVLSTLIASKPGHRLIATARNPTDLANLPDDDRGKNILKLPLDVTSAASVNDAFAAAEDHFGPGFHLDVVVNNAGYSLSGDIESATEEETHRELETLFFGTARVTTRAVENMRQSADRRRGGVVFNVSSLAGQCGFAGHAYYHAGKWAVEGWTESVAREVHPQWNKEAPPPSFECVHPRPLIDPRNSQLLHPGAERRQDKFRRAQQGSHRASSGMPGRVLEKYVEMVIKSGRLTEPSAIAEAIYGIASRGERVPLRVPLG